MQDLDFVIVDPKKWESLPIPTSPHKPDKYDKVLDALEAGEIIQLKAESENDLKGKRIALGRKSRARGFVVEFRNEGLALYARKTGQEIQPKAAKQPRQHKDKEMVTQEV